MPTFILLMKLTEQGIKRIKEAPEVTATAIAGEPTRYVITVRWIEPGTDGRIDFILSMQT